MLKLCPRRMLVAVLQMVNLDGVLVLLRQTEVCSQGLQPFPMDQLHLRALPTSHVAADGVGQWVHAEIERIIVSA